MSTRPAAALPVRGAVDAALAAWDSDAGFTEQTRIRASETLDRFARRLVATGVGAVEDITPAACRDFIDARTTEGRPPELATRHARRVALRMWFRTLRDLDLADGDPTLDIELPPRSSLPARPLTDDEMLLCRAAARLGQAGGTSLQRAVALALGEATAVSSEISTIRIHHVDDLKSPRWVRLPGTRRHDPRLGELSDWGSVIVARQIKVLRDKGLPKPTLLTYRGKGTPGQHVAQAATCNALGEILRTVGLSEQSDVRPASIRNWAGRHLYDQGMPLERVALRMGARKLDQAAEDIALDWRP
jgi:integrase/recombinase XerC